MIGHIKPKVCKLPSETKDEYMKLYCSICHSLKSQFGILGTLLVNSELAIILLALRNYYTPEERQYRCPAKLRCTSKPISVHKAVNCASKFSFLLGWLKVLDWETDRPSRYKKWIRKSLDRRAYSLLATLSKESLHVVEEYRDLTAGNSSDFSDVRRMSRLLSRTICIELGKQTMIDSSDLMLLSDFFGLIGEIVALADPLIDLRKDIEAKEYNPIRESVVRNNSDISSEYGQHLSEYRRMESQIKSELDDPGLQNILNDDFTTTLRLGLDRLSSRITRKRDEFFEVGSGLHSKNTIAVYGLSAIFRFSRPYPALYGSLRTGLSGQKPVNSTTHEDQPGGAGYSINKASQDSKKPGKSKRKGRRRSESGGCWGWCEGLECCCILGDGCGDCDCDVCDCDC